MTLLAFFQTNCAAHVSQVGLIAALPISDTFTETRVSPAYRYDGRCLTNNKKSIYKSQNLAPGDYSKHMHAHAQISTCTHEHTDDRKQFIHTLKWAGNRDLRVMKTAA